MMPLPLRSLCCCCFFLLIFSPTPTSQTALVAPITKDHSTLLYSLSIYLKTPPQLTNLHLDLGSSFNWVVCDANYTSSTYNHTDCFSPRCTSFEAGACSNCYLPPGPNCANSTCGLFPENPVTRKSILDIAILDTLALPTKNGSGEGPLATVSDFIFSCSNAPLLKGLAKHTSGLAGLGRNVNSLPAQISSSLSLPQYFALCLSGSEKSHGVGLFGSSGPYLFSPGIDLSQSLTYTPLLLNPVGDTVITYPHLPSSEYFINLTSIKVNGKPVPLNTTALNIDKETGAGGTKISTATPFTILDSSVYKAFTELFVNEAAALNLTVTTPIKPFTVCYPAEQIISTRSGPAVPTVDLVMHSVDAFWRIFGSNSMVRMTKNSLDLWCLGFLDGGATKRPIVIGGYQLEDHLLQFDLDSNRLGFSPSVLLQGTSCANFNF